MKLPKPTNDGSDFTPLAAGMQVACCCGLVDLGSQYHEGGVFQGKRIAPRTTRDVKIIFEIEPGKLADGSDDPADLRSDGTRFTVSRDFPMLTSPKSNFLKFLNSWRGVPFTPADFGVFELRTLIGARAQLTIVHKKTNDGKTYVNIDNIMPRPKGSAPRAVPVVPVWYLSMFEGEGGVSEFDNDLFETLPEWLRTKIASSKEFKEIAMGGADDTDSTGFGDDHGYTPPAGANAGHMASANQPPPF